MGDKNWNELELKLYQGHSLEVKQILTDKQIDNSYDALYIDWIKAEIAISHNNLREAKQLCIHILDQIKGQEWEKKFFVKCKMTLGKTARAIGDLTSAQAFYQEVLTKLIHSSPTIELAHIHYLLGNLNLFQKKFKVARKHYNDNLSVCTSIESHPWYRARAQFGLGNINFYEGSFNQALENFIVGLEIIEGLEDDRLNADLQLNIASIYIQQSQWKIAHSHIKNALRIYQLLNDETSVMFSTQKLAQVLMALGQHTHAIEVMDQLELSFIANSKSLSIDFLMLRVRFLMETGDVERTKQELTKIIDRSDLTTKQKVKVLDDMIKVSYIELNFQKSLELSEKLLTIKEVTEDKLSFAVALSHQGLNLINLHQTQEGLNSINKSLSMFEKTKNFDSMSDLYYATILALLNTNFNHEALIYLKEELEIKKKKLKFNSSQLIPIYLDILTICKLVENTKLEKAINNSLQKIMKFNTSGEEQEEIAFQTSRIAEDKNLYPEIRKKIHRIEKNIQGEENWDKNL